MYEMRTKIDYWRISNSLYLRIQLYMEARVKLRTYLTSVHFDPYRYYMGIISKLSEKVEYLYEMRTKKYRLSENIR